METIKISGHSDDIIHVESKNRRLDDEHQGGDDGGERVVVETVGQAVEMLGGGA